MRLKALRVITVLFVLSECALFNAFAQAGDNKPLTDLPRQYAATAFGQAGSLAGKRHYSQKPFRLANVYLQK